MEEFKFKPTRFMVVPAFLFPIMSLLAALIFILSIVQMSWSSGMKIPSEFIRGAIIPVIIFAFAMLCLISLVRYIVRTTKISLYDDKISKKCGTIQAILWSEINKVKVFEDAKGNIRSIVLYSDSKGKMYVDFYDNMGRILSLIKEKVPKETQWQAEKANDFFADWLAKKI